MDRGFVADLLENIFRLERKVSALQARLDEINANAAAYVSGCEEAKRRSNQTSGDRLYPDYHKANEGLCAVRIVLATKTEKRK